jgi:ribosomal-protein-serine acetyltransferase
MKQFAKIISDENLSLRQLEPTFTNAQMIFDALNFGRENIGRWLGWEKYVQRPEDEYDWLKSHENNKEKIAWCIFDGEKFCGAIDVHRIHEKERFGEIGYWLADFATGRGLALRALRLLETELFSDDGLNRIEIRVEPGNERSANVAHRAGYIQEGILREEYLNVFGENSDIIVFSKLKKELNK